MVLPFGDLAYLSLGREGKMIKLKLQKVLLFIPFINATIILIYVYNTMKMNWIGRKFLLGLGISFLVAGLSTALYEIILLLPLNYIWANVLNLAYIYYLLFYRNYLNPIPKEAGATMSTIVQYEFDFNPIYTFLSYY